jgi:hypothetical protein
MKIVTQPDTQNKVQQNKTKGSSIGCGCFFILLLFMMCMCAALPKHLNYLCKGKQCEAEHMLGTICRMQEKYMSEHDTYADNEALGFTVKGKYYTYNIIRNSPTSYTAEAVSDNDGKGIKQGAAGDDIWTINEELTLMNVKNACQ